MQPFLEELKRRNVFRVAIAYGVSAWFVLQLSDVVLDHIGTSDWVFSAILWILLIGFAAERTHSDPGGH